MTTVTCAIIRIWLKMKELRNTCGAMGLGGSNLVIFSNLNILVELMVIWDLVGLSLDLKTNESLKN
jgi:hypothetical protein